MIYKKSAQHGKIYYQSTTSASSLNEWLPVTLTIFIHLPPVSLPSQHPLSLGRRLCLAYNYLLISLTSPSGCRYRKHQENLWYPWETLTTRILFQHDATCWLLNAAAVVYKCLGVPWPSQRVKRMQCLPLARFRLFNSWVGWTYRPLYLSPQSKHIQTCHCEVQQNKSLSDWLISEGGCFSADSDEERPLFFAFTS